MQFSKKTWYDRVGENLNRRILAIVSQDTSTMVVDVDRGDRATTQGTPLNAETFNDLETRIASAISDGNGQINSIGTDISDIRTDIDNIYTGSERANYVADRCLLDDGQIIDAPGYCVSNTIYLPVIPDVSGLEILYDCTTHTDVEGTGKAMSLCVYDETGSRVATLSAKTDDYVDIPVTARTIVASFNLSDTSVNQVMFKTSTGTASSIYKVEISNITGINGLNGKVDGVANSINDAYARINTVSGNVASLESNVQTNTTDIINLKGAVDDAFRFVKVYENTVSIQPNSPLILTFTQIPGYMPVSLGLTYGGGAGYLLFNLDQNKETTSKNEDRIQIRNVHPTVTFNGKVTVYLLYMKIGASLGPVNTGVLPPAEYVNDITAPTTSAGAYSSWMSYKIGNLVTIMGTFRFSSAVSNQWVNCGTIANHRPSKNAAGHGFNNTNQQRNPTGYFLTTGGVLNIIGTFNANDIVDFTFTYIASS